MRSALRNGLCLFVGLACCLVAKAQENNAGVTIPPTYFGMHINSSSTAWPTVKFGTQRLWDSGVSWTAINTARGTYNWSGLDNRVNVAGQKGLQLIYTFGRTPQWASSNPTLSTCGYGPGQCAPPADLNDWDTYVRAIATRYAGRIHAYEIWNEPNHADFYQGSLSTLVEMARRAYTIIKAVDPNAIVITPCPTHTSTTPEQWMDQYFAAGGNSWYDVVGFHGYSSVTTRLNGLKNVLTKYGQSGRPIWDTEASWSKYFHPGPGCASGCSGEVVPATMAAGSAEVCVVRMGILGVGHAVGQHQWDP